MREMYHNLVSCMAHGAASPHSATSLLIQQRHNSQYLPSADSGSSYSDVCGPNPGCLILINCCVSIRGLMTALFPCPFQDYAVIPISHQLASSFDASSQRACTPSALYNVRQAPTAALGVSGNHESITETDHVLGQNAAGGNPHLDVFVGLRACCHRPDSDQVEHGGEAALG